MKLSRVSGSEGKTMLSVNLVSLPMLLLWGSISFAIVGRGNRIAWILPALTLTATLSVVYALTEPGGGISTLTTVHFLHQMLGFANPFVLWVGAAYFRKYRMRKHTNKTLA
jgi:hypothetical protein